MNPMLEIGHVRERIAGEVRAEAARQGLSHGALADDAGIAKSTFSNKIRAESGFTIEELIRIARVLNVKASMFLDTIDLAGAEAVAS